jgi:hypothetical protein
MSNPNNSPSEELLEILHTINNNDPRKKYVVTSLPGDIQELFDKELEKPPYEAPYRSEPWQFWYNNRPDELSTNKMIDYTNTLYALHYIPKLEYKDGNRDIRYDINSDQKTQNEVLKFVKKDFEKVINCVNQYTPFNNMESSQQCSKPMTNQVAIDNYEIPTLKQLFESEKANIASIIMQSDQKLNEFLLDFLIKLVILVREGLVACKYIDDKCKLKVKSDYDIVELLNRSMPLARRQHKMDNESYAHVTPGSFTVTRETLTIEGIKSLNFREKVQLMNCFWNCTSHKLEGNNDDNSNIYEKIPGNRQCKDIHLKIRTKHKTAPVLNMIYEKVAKNKNLILTELDNSRSLNNLKRFIENIETFKGRIDKEKKGNKDRVKNKNFPPDHTIPSGRYPLCYDYNETKKRWKPVVDNVDEGESESFPVVITDDFLINIERRFQNYVNNPAREKQILTSLKMSDNEKIYMKEYETNKTAEIDNGYIYWTTGFSLSKLNLDGVLSYNMIRQAEIANDTFTSGETKEEEERAVNKNYKYIKSGLSGSTWKYLQLAYFMGSNENKIYLDRMYHVAIAFLVGCYHHSWYEVTRAALDFRRELEKNTTGIYYSGDDLKLNIDDSFWILNRKSNLWHNSNTSLHASTRKYLKSFFLSETAEGGEGLNPKSHNNYLHFYRKFLHPLIPLKSGVGSIKKLLEKMQSELANNVSESSGQQIKTSGQQITTSGRTSRRSQWMNDYVTNGGKGKKTRKRQSGRRTRRTPRYSGGNKTRKRKSKFPYISRGGGLI